MKNKYNMRFNASYFIVALLLFIVEYIIGTYIHDAIIRPFGGDFLVVILVYCFVKSFVDTHIMPTALGVLCFAYIVEVTQYFQLIDLLGLTNSLAAQLIMGTHFSWTDMLMYTLGIILVIVLELMFSAQKIKQEA